MERMLVTLSLVAGPGFPSGCVDHRYEIELALDAAGQPDAQAWAEDPAPWRARRFRPDAPAERRLRDVPDLRRARKAARLGQADEILKPLGFHLRILLVR